MWRCCCRRMCGAAAGAERPGVRDKGRESQRAIAGEVTLARGGCLRRRCSHSRPAVVDTSGRPACACVRRGSCGQLWTDGRACGPGRAVRAMRPLLAHRADPRARACVRRGSRDGWPRLRSCGAVPGIAGRRSRRRAAGRPCSRARGRSGTLGAAWLALPVSCCPSCCSDAPSPAPRRRRRCRSMLRAGRCRARSRSRRRAIGTAIVCPTRSMPALIRPAGRATAARWSTATATGSPTASTSAPTCPRSATGGPTATAARRKASELHAARASESSARRGAHARRSAAGEQAGARRKQRAPRSERSGGRRRVLGGSSEHRGADDQEDGDGCSAKSMSVAAWRAIRRTATGACDGGRAGIRPGRAAWAGSGCGSGSRGTGQGSAGSTG